MSVKIIDIAKGVQGYYIQNDRFNTTLISYNFYLPLRNEDMTENALLPFMLTSCCSRYKDYIELNLRLLELYGADLSAKVSKLGDLMHIQLSISVINDEFALDMARPVRDAAELMNDILFRPSVDGGAFLDSDLSREKRKTIERIEGEINNKRSYASTRLLSEMFGDEPYGKFIYGTVSSVKGISGERLYKTWQNMLEKAYIRINVSGKSLPETIFSSFKNESVLQNREWKDLSCPTKPLEENDRVNYVTDRLDVTQGKLGMGFSCDMYGDFKTAAPLIIFSDVFGGGPYSKLFSNVREKQSLCYYCSASARRTKGFLTVSSGIEQENADRLVSAVLKELEDMKQGNFDDEAVASSKRAITDSLLGYYDNLSALDLWYAKQQGDIISPEEAAEIIERVSRESIIEAAQKVKLHTVYRLLPLGQEGKNE